MIKICEICGKEFVTRTRIGKVCGKECRKIKMKRYLDEWNKKNPLKTLEYSRKYTSAHRIERRIADRDRKRKRRPPDAEHYQIELRDYSDDHFNQDGLFIGLRNHETDSVNARIILHSPLHKAEKYITDILQGKREYVDQN